MTLNQIHTIIKFTYTYTFASSATNFLNTTLNKYINKQATLNEIQNYKTIDTKFSSTINNTNWNTSKDKKRNSKQTITNT